MRSAAKPQIASVEQPFGCEPPKPCCPVCGHCVLRTDPDGLAHADPCPHLAFVFVGEVGDFEYRSPDFTRRAAHRRTHDLDLARLRTLLVNAGYGNGLLSLEITYGGMACGPVWYTDVYGFDYGMLAEGKEEDANAAGSGG